MITSMNPYKNLDDRSFWAPSVANRNLFDINNLWKPKFPIDKKSRIVTYGSCFAQHIGIRLKSAGFDWSIYEVPPPGMNPSSFSKFSYNIFSSRTGNIYTASLLNQWVSLSTASTGFDGEIYYDKKQNRYFDNLRPTVEENGFCTNEEILLSRFHTFECFKKSILNSDIFIFTLGLTESWHNKISGIEYPICPGVAAGEFNKDIHIFKNQSHSDIYKSLRDVIFSIRKLNPKIKFLLTVSPVPLTATMTNHHVLVATIFSKSILRSVAGLIANKLKYVDYFPSYEIISSFPYKGIFYQPNLRNVNSFGVSHVMNSFFDSIENKGLNAKINIQFAKSKSNEEEDQICDEILLDAFRTNKS
jgi:hypothetical protein